MRLLDLHIDGWRNFRAVRLSIPADASLVCLVGENGTGKSNILEFISAAAHHLGLASGIEARRGNPFQEPHQARFVMRVSDRYRAPVEHEVLPEHVQQALPDWDGTLALSTRLDDAGAHTVLSVGGIGDQNASSWLANHVVNAHRQSREVNYLHLDADRAYPPVSIHPQHVVEAWGQPYESPEWTRQWSHRTTRTLYEEWIKYFLATETRLSTRFTASVREARRLGSDYPELVDPFESFSESVKEVLPHLTFTGVDTERRTIHFDSAGTDINFDQLSGGEREIAFLVGQIERFQLRTGLLLLDEPELHLNPDLVRSWVAYLRDTVHDGQAWIGTHSLEAVEVAGPDATFVLERDGDTRIVDRADPLASREVISVLSGTLGSPAFSISRLRFVYVEGERATRERERFHAIVGDPAKNRFIEAGNAREVLRRIKTLSELAAEAGEPLRIGGVIDRDFRTDGEIAVLEADGHVHVLRVLEIENLLLQPEALATLLDRAGDDRGRVHEVIRAGSDRFAGMWILQRAAKIADERDLQPTIRAAAGGMTWAAFGADPDGTARALADHQALEPERDRALRDALAAAAITYAQLRENPDELWKGCLGKQVVSAIPQAVGLTNAVTLERAVIRLWQSGECAPSPEGGALAAYVGGL